MSPPWNVPPLDRCHHRVLRKARVLFSFANGYAYHVGPFALFNVEGRRSFDVFSPWYSVQVNLSPGRQRAVQIKRTAPYWQPSRTNEPSPFAIPWAGTDPRGPVDISPQQLPEPDGRYPAPWGCTKYDLFTKEVCDADGRVFAYVDVFRREDALALDEVMRRAYWKGFWRMVRFRIRAVWSTK